MSTFRFFGAVAGALWRERALGPQAVARFQKARLRRLVQHASARVPIYRNIYAGVDPTRFDVTDLPPVDKAFLMERFDDTVADRAVTLAQVQEFCQDPANVGRELPGGLVVAMTSGTTGRVGYFLSEPAAWEQTRGVIFARVLRRRLLNPFNVLRFGPWRKYRMAYVTAVGGPYITHLLGSRYPPLALLAADPRTYSVLTPLRPLCDALNQAQPHYLHGYPTFLESLAHEQLQGRLSIAPEVMSLGSEPLTPSARASLHAAFPTTLLRETYGTTECPTIATECSHGHMHVNEDVCLLESVDMAGYPVPEGQAGAKVLVTNLACRAQPIIRYEMGDQVVLSSTPCACGSPFRTVQVLGRTDDTFYLRGTDGRFRAHTPIPFETLFLQVPGLKQYQLVHQAQNELRVHYTRDTAVEQPVVEQALTGVFNRYFQDHGLQGCITLHLDLVAEIPRDPSTQKVRQIINRAPLPENMDEVSGPWRLSRPPPSP
jgi:phenylacetate-coenzyme A ligase PaaK-like adenylate-forming protein